MRTQKYIVTGHYCDEKETQEQLFGRLPVGYDGDEWDLDGDNKVFYWLGSDENIVVGEEYGDFIVTCWEVA